MERQDGDQVDPEPALKVFASDHFVVIDGLEVVGRKSRAEYGNHVHEEKAIYDVVGYIETLAVEVEAKNQRRDVATVNEDQRLEEVPKLLGRVVLRVDDAPLTVTPLFHSFQLVLQIA